MDGISDDAELGQEVLRLLHAKLREARQELQDQRREFNFESKPEVVLLDSADLQRQNKVLRDELTSWRLRLSELEDTKGVLNEDRTPEAALEDQSSALKDQKFAADADIQQRKAELAEYKSLYRKTRADVTGLQEILATLQADIEHERKELDNLRCNVIAAERELCTQGPPADAVQPLDITGFLSANLPHSRHPARASLKAVLNSAPLVELPAEMMNRFGPEILVLSPEEVIWSKDGISRALFVMQPFRYDPISRGNSGSWHSNPSVADLTTRIGQERALFFRRKNDWYYYGQYQIVGYAPLSPDSSKTLDATVLHNVQVATATHKDHMAPVALKFIDSLYAEGILGLECVGLERTGFNFEFQDALLSSVRAIQVVNSLAALQGRKAPSVIGRLKSDEPLVKTRDGTA